VVRDDVKDRFTPDLMGSLPDGRVADTVVEDWQAVLDLVRSLGRSCEYFEDGVAVRLICGRCGARTARMRCAVCCGRSGAGSASL
jgi:hypothetical protein